MSQNGLQAGEKQICARCRYLNKDTGNCTAGFLPFPEKKSCAAFKGQREQPIVTFCVRLDITRVEKGVEEVIDTCLLGDYAFLREAQAIQGLVKKFKAKGYPIEFLEEGDRTDGQTSVD